MQWKSPCWLGFWDIFHHFPMAQLCSSDISPMVSIGRGSGTSSPGMRQWSVGGAAHGSPGTSRWGHCDPPTLWL